MLITPHRYAARWKRYEALSGIYNVQFVTFRDDAQGSETLRWWRDRCLEWCYFRAEDGKLGDQKYLDDWPERFRRGARARPSRRRPRTLERRERTSSREGTGAWWSTGSRSSSTTTTRSVSTPESPGCAASVSWRESYNYSPGAQPLVWRTGYPLDTATRGLLWEPYVRRLGEALGEIRRLEPGFEAGFEHLQASRIVSHGLRRRIRAASERLPGRLATSRRHVDTWRGRGVAHQMT